MSSWQRSRRARRERDADLVHAFLSPLREPDSGVSGDLARKESKPRSFGPRKRRIAVMAVGLAGVGGTGYAAIRAYESGVATLQPAVKISVPKRSNVADDRSQCLHLEGMRVRDAQGVLIAKGFTVTRWNFRKEAAFVRRLTDPPPGGWIVVQVLDAPSAVRAVYVEVRAPSDALASGPFKRLC